MDGWMDGCKSQVKDCLQQSKIEAWLLKLDFHNFLSMHIDRPAHQGRHFHKNIARKFRT